MMNEYVSLHQKKIHNTPSEKMDINSNARVITITSGKGGVGKTNITTNLGIALAIQGARVCIFDADTNLANINILLGINPEYTLEHFLNGEKTIQEILADGPRGIKIIPAASGIANFSNLAQSQREKLIGALAELESEYDYLLIDTAAGIGEDVISFVKSAQYTILVISPEPTSLTDAFSLLKTLKRDGYSNPIYVMVNMVLDYGNSMEVYSRFEMAVDKYLQLKVHYVGYISLDESVISSVRLQQPVIIQKPEAPASKCFHSLATGLSRRFSSETEPYSFSDFWKEQSLNIGLPETRASETANAASTTTEVTYDESAGGSTDQTAAKTTANTTISSFGQLTETVHTFLDRQEAPDESHEKLIQSLIDDYVDRFDAFPLDIRKSLFHALEIQDFPMSEIRELAISLESLYEKRNQRPIHSQDETLLKLLEDASYSESHLLDLYHRVQSCYKRRFKADLEHSEDILARKLEQDDFTEQDFSDLIDSIKSTYHKRFDKPYMDDSDHLLRDVSQIAEQMVGQEAHLHDRLAHLTEILSDTITAREGLLNKLSPIKPAVQLDVHPDTQQDTQQEVEQLEEFRE